LEAVSAVAATAEIGAKTENAAIANWMTRLNLDEGMVLCSD
jgi:hypothetical protein